jgi:hypothetical protein
MNRRIVGVFLLFISITSSTRSIQGTLDDICESILSKLVNIMVVCCVLSLSKLFFNEPSKIIVIFNKGIEWFLKLFFSNIFLFFFFSFLPSHSANMFMRFPSKSINYLISFIRCGQVGDEYGFCLCVRWVLATSPFGFDHPQIHQHFRISHQSDYID